MAPPHYAGPVYRTWHHAHRVICIAVYAFLVAPLIAIIPLSFNAEPYFTFTPGMLSLDPEAFSLRWYREILEDPQWPLAIRNSIVVAVTATAIATALGTLAALGLSQSAMPYRTLVMSVLISPMIVPLIITAVGTYFFYSELGLAQTLPGLILAHAALGTPFVVITVTATLVGFDRTLLRASASLGADPATTFFKVTMPLILPGVVSGALFAFVISFDEPVVVLFLAGFEQRTIPRQMWAGVREQISPDILAVATVLITVSVVLLITIELLRRRTERLRGRKS
ncbi:MAG: ABC transporter permease [Gammaproteobacteria bacterium]|nr:ABC transporter permease [Gammaproteobacteria bacterium]NIR85605.1 ABC transporter permease [Gammaproteobacteria bacterium]NIR90046.1 ABC transporter permease [Gammaproteobacteria bacterium]NIU06734.1 ABC transporter permease [Gammaproteobacteria bacterium]NIV53665.1 ABC transporter permease subunit [Gammaproteobacteria bacterium]